MDLSPRKANLLPLSTLAISRTPPSPIPRERSEYQLPQILYFPHIKSADANFVSLGSILLLGVVLLSLRLALVKSSKVLPTYPHTRIPAYLEGAWE